VEDNVANVAGSSAIAFLQIYCWMRW